MNEESTPPEKSVVRHGRQRTLQKPTKSPPSKGDQVRVKEAAKQYEKGKDVLKRGALSQTA